jgi:phosphoribosylaminoimidazole-succinocarboxamide synthase
MMVPVIENTPDVAGLTRSSGKVRESYVGGNGVRAIVVTDRISVFDWVIGCVPHKGRVLNAIAAHWFGHLSELGIPHHLISVPHPNVSYTIDAKPLPLEFVVRGYLTGSTTTSSWFAYQNHDRRISGVEMPTGMRRGERFPENILTPSTKGAGGHDENISRDEVISRGIVSADRFDEASELAMKMFAYGQQRASELGLILADTKYEFGVDRDGRLLVIDEVHTPDSSRYWIAGSYEDSLSAGRDPASLDKEFVRRMIVEAGYDVTSPRNPGDFFTAEMQQEASRKYLELHRLITGSDLDTASAAASSLEDAIRGVLDVTL